MSSMQVPASAVRSVPTLLAWMERRGIPLPESSETFTRELIDFAREQNSRDSTLYELDQVLAFMNGVNSR